MSKKSTSDELEQKDEVCRVIGKVQDVTERRKAEGALQESETKYKEFVEGTDDLVTRVDKEGIFLYVNHISEEIFGIPPEEAVGLSAFDFIHPDDQENTRIWFNECIEKKRLKASIENRQLNKITGKVSNMLWTSNYKYDTAGRLMGINGIAHNITDRKQMETSQQESKEKYKSLSKMLRLMCDNVPDMIWAKDLEKRYIFVNHALCRNLLNASDTEEPIGKTDLFFAERERASHPNDPNWHTFGELCQDTDTIAMESGVPQRFDEFGNIKGEYLFLDVYKAPFVDEAGEMIGTVGSARDMTEARKIDGELKKWNEDLEEKIKNRTSSLEDVNTALRVLLEKREEDKNQMGANIYANFKSLIQPLLSQLRKSHTQDAQDEIIDILESTIEEMATPFSKKLSDPMVGLTPTEIQVAALVKQGKTNKEIAQTLNKSIRAVTSHRNNMRQKLGLKNEKINLRTYLFSLNE